MGSTFVLYRGNFYRREVTQDNCGMALEYYRPVPVGEVLKAGYDPAKIAEISMDPTEFTQVY